MVGIVIISHSRKVAEGIKDIALQMADTLELKIIPCGGNKEGGIGTDPDAITAAVKEAYSEEGVIITADLGSAVMSAELVIDTLTPDIADNIRIANAPVLEGTVLAAIESSAGGNLESVLKSAEEAARMEKIS